MMYFNGVFYSVIQGKFRASLEPLWVMKITRYRVTHAYVQQIHFKLPFMLSNKVELFECIQSLSLRNAISTYILWLYYIAYMRMCKRPFTDHSY